MGLLVQTAVYFAGLKCGCWHISMQSSSVTIGGLVIGTEFHFLCMFPSDFSFSLKSSSLQLVELSESNVVLSLGRKSMCICTRVKITVGLALQKAMMQISEEIEKSVIPYIQRKDKDLEGFQCSSSILHKKKFINTMEEK